MANSRVCDSCSKSSATNCVGHFTAPSRRTDLTKGQQPKRQVYSYKCPNAPR